MLSLSQQRSFWKKNRKNLIKFIWKWILISILPIPCYKVVSSQVLLYEWVLTFSHLSQLSVKKPKLSKITHHEHYEIMRKKSHKNQLPTLTEIFRLWEKCAWGQRGAGSRKMFFWNNMPFIFKWQVLIVVLGLWKDMMHFGIGFLFRTFLLHLLWSQQNSWLSIDR